MGGAVLLPLGLYFRVSSGHDYQVHRTSAVAAPPAQRRRPPRRCAVRLRPLPHTYRPTVVTPWPHIRPWHRCPTEICAFNDMAAEFEAINCQLIACSVDSKYSHLAYSYVCPWPRCRASELECATPLPLFLFVAFAHCARGRRAVVRAHAGSSPGRRAGWRR